MKRVLTLGKSKYRAARAELDRIIDEINASNNSSRWASLQRIEETVKKAFEKVHVDLKEQLIAANKKLNDIFTDISNNEKEIEIKEKEQDELLNEIELALKEICKWNDRQMKSSRNKPISPDTREDEKDDEKKVESKQDTGESSTERLNRLINWFKELEDMMMNRKVVVAIGNTGMGKSTFLNRLLGDTSIYGDGKTIDGFKTDDGPNSCTKSVEYKFLELTTNDDNKVNNDNNNTENKSNEMQQYCFIDTPGMLDTDGKDEEIKFNIASNLYGIGGVNAFLVFIDLTKTTIDGSYIKLLNHYSGLFKNENNSKNDQSDKPIISKEDKSDSTWWDHVILVGPRHKQFVVGLEKDMLVNKIDKQDKNAVNQFIDKKLDEKRVHFQMNDKLNDESIKDANLMLVTTGDDPVYPSAVTNVFNAVNNMGKYNCRSVGDNLKWVQMLTNAAKLEKSIQELKNTSKKLEKRQEKLTKQIKKMKPELENFSSV